MEPSPRASRPEKTLGSWAVTADITCAPRGIHLEADSTTQEFKLFHGKGGLYIGKAVLKNNVFVLDFVPDQGTADSDAIVNFASWTHPPDLDPDFSPGGFWHSHTIPEAERTRALATIRQEETTSTAAETTSATTATPTAPIAGSSTAPVLIYDTPPTPAQQLTPTPREVHRSANLTAGFYSNSDLHRRSPGHRASESLWHKRLGHPSNTTLNNTIKASVLDKDSLLLPDGRELQRWGIHLGIEKHYNAWKILDVHSKETVAACDVIFYERLTLRTYLDNLAANRDLTGGFHGNRAFASAADEADWDEQNVDGASEEAGPLPYCSVPIPMDNENPRDSDNAEAYLDFADNELVTSWPVGQPHASASVFPVARLGRVAIFVMSRARVARDVCFALSRSGSAPGARDGACLPACLSDVRHVARDSALSRRGPAFGARDGTLRRRGPAPGARDGALRRHGPALGARDAPATAPLPHLAPAFEQPPLPHPRLPSEQPPLPHMRLHSVQPPVPHMRLHSVQPPLPYPPLPFPVRHPFVAVGRLLPRHPPPPPPPPSSSCCTCSRGGEGMEVAGMGVMGGMVPSPPPPFVPTTAAAAGGRV
ncbi:unnamed protein product [Closterium sp. NIES-53]